jgi:uncharacterized SAM-dependent methyltransferase
MKIETLLTEAEISEEFAEAMEARDVPEKFFYWHPLCVRAWLALSQGVTYESRLHSWNLLVDDTENISSHLDSIVAVISLGAGDGAQDVLLLKALQSVKLDVDYFPVDASQQLLEMACAAAEDEEVDTLGLKADISSPMHLVLAADASEHPKLFLLCGNTLGGFDPLDEVKHLSQGMHEGDRLIVDAEIYDKAAALASRDNPVGRQFAFAPLAGFGISKDDGDIRFEERHDERHEGLCLITRRFQTGRDLRLTVADRDITLQRGERVSLSFNYTYSIEAFRWVLTKHGGLKILHEYPSPDGRYVTVVCSR